jgi:hypothetical protein
MIKPTRACKISKKELRLGGAKKFEKRHKDLQIISTGAGEFLFPMIKMRARIIK